MVILFCVNGTLIRRAQMEVTQHARYTCTFCGKVRSRPRLPLHHQD
jgi:transposase-like protein